MIVLRNIASHFPARAPEWIMGAGLTFWGARLTASPDAFEVNTNMAVLGSIADEATWGTVAIVVGVLRLIALFVNGSFAGFPYSPHLRFWTASISCFVWVSIWVSLVGSVTGVAAYLMILCVDVNNVWRAAGDMGAQRAQNGS